MGRLPVSPRLVQQQRPGAADRIEGDPPLLGPVGFLELTPQIPERGVGSLPVGHVAGSRRESVEGSRVSSPARSKSGLRAERNPENTCTIGVPGLRSLLELRRWPLVRQKAGHGMAAYMALIERSNRKDLPNVEVQVTLIDLSPGRQSWSGKFVSRSADGIVPNGALRSPLTRGRRGPRWSVRRCLTAGPRYHARAHDRHGPAGIARPVCFIQAAPPPLRGLRRALQAHGLPPRVQATGVQRTDPLVLQGGGLARLRRHS